MNLQTYTAPVGTVSQDKDQAAAPFATASRKDPASNNTMPVLIPVPIETKDKNAWDAFWTWYFATREWVFAEDWEFHLPETGETYVIPKGFQFDGASIPKRLRAYLSPVGLLLVPGIIHDFGYRYDYVWLREADGSLRRAYAGAGREHWDALFFKVGNYVNGVFIINWLAHFALALAGGIAWRRNRRRISPDLRPG